MELDRNLATMGAREQSVLGSQNPRLPATPGGSITQQHDLPVETSIEIPSDPSAFTEHWKDNMASRLLKYAFRCSKNAKGQCRGPPLTESEVQNITSHCQALLAIKLNSQQVKACNVRNNLDAMLGRLNGKPTEFPQSVVGFAQQVFDRFEAERWGAQADEEAAASHSATSPIAASSNGGNTGVGLRAPADHPIWGVNGIMRGIIRTPTNGLRIDKQSPDKRPHDVFGDNGLTVGQWWPKRLCALRDGAHGSSQGGISMKQAEGVFSLVISSAYEGLDQDQGSTIWYSMPGAADNADPNNHQASDYVKAMDRTRHLFRPIRVLRTEGAGWSGRPLQGLRYDGLYKITACEPKHNRKGGLYWRYKLERLSGQVDLEACRARPTGAEMDQMDRIKNYW